MEHNDQDVFYQARPTDLRLNANYVIWYVNIGKLMVQGVIPFACLSFLNYRIYWVMKRRRHLANRPFRAPSQAGPAAAATLNGADAYAATAATALNGGGARNNEAKNNSAVSAERKATEERQAAVLFIIVLLFFITYTPR